MATLTEVRPARTSGRTKEQRSRYHNRLWLVLVLALGFVYTGLLLQMSHSTTNAAPPPVQQSGFAVPTSLTD